MYVCGGGDPLNAVWRSWVFTVYVCVCGIWVDPVPEGHTRVGVVGVVCLFCVLRVPYLEFLGGMHVWCRGTFWVSCVCPAYVVVWCMGDVCLGACAVVRFCGGHACRLWVGVHLTYVLCL